MESDGRKCCFILSSQEVTRGQRLQESGNRACEMGEQCSRQKEQKSKGSDTRTRLVCGRMHKEAAMAVSKVVERLQSSLQIV